MRFGFLNNFASQLAAPVAEPDTTIELSEGADLLETALNDADAVALTLFVTDSQGAESKREVVYATAITGTTATVERGQEGTEAQAFTPGDEVEARLTAGVLSGLDQRFSLYEANTAAESSSICFGQGAENTDRSTVVLGPTASSNGGRNGVVIGSDAVTDDNDNVVIGPGASCMGGDDCVVIGENAMSHDDDNVVIGTGAVSQGDHSVIIGDGAEGIADDAVAIGESASAGDTSIAVGVDARSLYETGLAVGNRARINKLSHRSDSTDSSAIGVRTEVSSSGSVAVHTRKESLGYGHISVGYEAVVGKVHYDMYGSDDIFIEADRATAVGSRANVLSEGGAAIGAYSTVRQSAPMGIAIGPGADTGVESGLRITGLSYLPSTFDGGNDEYGESQINIGWSPDEPLNPDGTPVDINAVPVIKDLGLSPEVHNKQLPIARRSALQSVISTDAFSLSDVTAVATLDLPSNTIFLPDAFDVVVLEAIGAGGSPEIQIGPDDVTPDVYLAATPVTKTAVGGRETHTPLVTDGITALRVSVVTAGTGTAYKIKVVVRGYVMEI